MKRTLELEVTKEPSTRTGLIPRNQITLSLCPKPWTGILWTRVLWTMELWLELRHHHLPHHPTACASAQRKTRMTVEQDDAPEPKRQYFDDDHGNKAEAEDQMDVDDERTEPFDEEDEKQEQEDEVVEMEIVRCSGRTKKGTGPRCKRKGPVPVGENHYCLDHEDQK